jgi:hypothetical protein
MYPTLMAVGGVITLAWDYRRRVITPVISRLASARSPLAQTQPDNQAQEGLDAIELNDRPPRSPSQSSVKDASGAHINVSINIHSEAHGPLSHSSEASHPSSSGIHQRPTSNNRPLSSTAEQEQTEPSVEAPLLTLGTKPAIATTLAFVALVITFVVIKVTVHSLGRPFDVSQSNGTCLETYAVTCWTQFFVNMIIAGTIIFGGGPVVIPLLRGYTVDNGMSLLSATVLNGGFIVIVCTRRMGKCMFPS